MNLKKIVPTKTIGALQIDRSQTIVYDSSSRERGTKNIKLNRHTCVLFIYYIYILICAYTSTFTKNIQIIEIVKIERLW